ncbi:fumarylacetoacetate hydrolase family protein, partial [Staphylococcus aureus]|nr:fumarylacetoacetate hydrolase family protein [Staphylococcus aureus]
IFVFILDISIFVSLHPGDIIATGTPAGFCAGMQPPKFLQTGDEVKVTIDNIGTLKTYIAK